jgi:DNA-binding CsgD family transcriptional regulator
VIARAGTPRANEAVRQALERVASEAGLTACVHARLLEIAAGLTYREIARRHGISVNTVKSEVRTLLAALRAHCRHEIEDAATAARVRAEGGASAEELYRFLLLRLE